MRGAKVRGDLIRQLRLSKGMTQEQLANLADLDETTLRRMEKGERSFDVRTIADLAEALNCDLVMLLEGGDDPRPTCQQQQANLQCVAEHRQGFLEKNIERVLACYTEDAVVTFPASIPSESSGKFEGQSTSNQTKGERDAVVSGARRIHRKRFVWGAMFFISTLLNSTEIDAAIVILDPNSVVAGKSIGEWSAEQWKWTFGFSVPVDPFSDATGTLANLSQSGPVFFVAGNLGVSTPRAFEVPADKYLLFPLLVGELSQLEIGFDKTSGEVLAAAVDQANLIDELHASVDGVDIPNLFNYREVSPEFNYTAAPNNPIGVPPGDSGIAFADGYWLMVAPIPAGETHVFNFGGGISSFGFSIDQTSTITAVPEPGAILQIAIGCFVHCIYRRTNRSGRPRAI